MIAYYHKRGDPGRRKRTGAVGHMIITRRKVLEPAIVSRKRAKINVADDGFFTASGKRLGKNEKKKPGMVGGIVGYQPCHPQPASVMRKRNLRGRTSSVTGGKGDKRYESPGKKRTGTAGGRGSSAAIPLEIVGVK